MRNYTVHRPRRAIGDPDLETAQTVFVKEGFCWPALFFPLLWLILHRMWLVLLGFVVAVALIGGLLQVVTLDPVIVTVINVSVLFLFAAEAGELRRWTLGRKGYEFRQLIHGRSQYEAEIAYFTGWVDEYSAQKAAEVENEAEIAFRLGVPTPQMTPPQNPAPT